MFHSIRTGFEEDIVQFSREFSCSDRKTQASRRPVRQFRRINLVASLFLV